GIVDIVVIDDLLMKKDIDEIGHVMIGHEHAYHVVLDMHTVVRDLSLLDLC
ncbi:hypothetical protein Tco_1169009, partial [Tanacetum coccineum]